MNITINKGTIPHAIKVVAYGVESVGKSTFAASFPDSLFSDTEGSTKSMNVSRLPTPKTFNELLEEVKWVADNKPCKTYVIDTIDWAEKLIIDHVIKTHGNGNQPIKGIEDFGYGKGYTYVKEEFQRLLKGLDLVIAQGINVVITAHAQLRKVELPDQMGAYDHWELKLSKQVSPVLKEWTDILLFANFVTNTITDSSTKKKKGVGGTERVMHANHTAIYDAKNRYDLPDVMPFSYVSIAHLFRNEGIDKKQILNAIEHANFTEIVEQSDALNLIDDSNDKDIESAKVQKIRELMAKDGITEKEISQTQAERLGAKGMPNGTSLTVLSENIQDWIITYWKNVVEYINNNIRK